MLRTEDTSPGYGHYPANTSFPPGPPFASSAYALASLRALRTILDVDSAFAQVVILAHAILVMFLRVTSHVSCHPTQGHSVSFPLMLVHVHVSMHVTFECHATTTHCLSLHSLFAGYTCHMQHYSLAIVFECHEIV